MPSHETTNLESLDRELLYTRAEMREACRNNYNAALEKAALACEQVDLSNMRHGRIAARRGAARCANAIRELKEIA